MMPLAVIQPAPRDVQSVGIVVAEEGVGQFHLPDAVFFSGPGRDLFRALDRGLFARSSAIGDSTVFTGTAANGLDPLAIRSRVDGDDVPRLGNFRCFRDREIGPLLAAVTCIVSRLCDVNFTSRRAHRSRIQQRRQACQAEDHRRGERHSRVSNSEVGQVLTFPHDTPFRGSAIQWKWSCGQEATRLPPQGRVLGNCDAAPTSGAGIATIRGA